MLAKYCLVLIRETGHSYTHFLRYPALGYVCTLLIYTIFHPVFVIFLAGVEEAMVHSICQWE